MTDRRMITVDGNEAVTSVAHRTNEVAVIYPITPSSPMGESADAWSAAGRRNIWGAVPEITEMQSEAGAAGACHGALQAGSLATTFTASQGLLLMIPNMYKIAGELTPFCMHVSARTVASHALSIFGDHSDVMACRQTGFAMLASCSVQEAHDFAAIGQAATLKSRVPFLHFFDGFRTSHEINKVEELTDDDLRAMIDDHLVAEHRKRALSPDRPVIRGTAQNPDTFFQMIEARNPYHEACPQIVQETMDKFASLTGRQYQLFQYEGHPEAEQVIVIMGSGAETAQMVVEHENAKGAKLGLLKVRLYRPFSVDHFIAALPPTVKAIAVMDRTKEHGSVGEPLFLDVVMALHKAKMSGLRAAATDPLVIGGRYGLSSKEFTPAMVKSVFEELAKDKPKPRFTVGIIDDVTGLSLPVDEDYHIKDPDETRAVFWGLGSDGTVGANKNSIKIISENTDNYAQGYFVYDSKKAGSVTISHLRFSPHKITRPYQIQKADFLACHQFNFLAKYDVLDGAAEGATVLLNSPHDPQDIWDKLPQTAQFHILQKNLKLYAIDALKVAREAGMGGRINTVMQTCFFAISNVLPKDEAIAQIKKAIQKSYGHKSQKVVDMNNAAVDAALAHLHEVPLGDRVSSNTDLMLGVPQDAPDFVKQVSAMILSMQGELLPVSAFPPDGTWPVGTTRYEKRNIAFQIPEWNPDLCIQCNKCALVCPHAAIRVKTTPEDNLQDAPPSFLSMDYKGKELPGEKYIVQVAPEDCTGCGVCVTACLGKDKKTGERSIEMAEQPPILEREKANWDFFLSLPEVPREKVTSTVKMTQFLQPLMEFSGACSGCGETPYIKLATQLYGDRMLIANATGCSSIYGGNLPTTPYTTNADGRGPAWSNSLFEDNAEFGFGFRLSIDQHQHLAQVLLQRLAPVIGEELVAQILLGTGADTDVEIATQRERIAALKAKLKERKGRRFRALDGIGRLSGQEIGVDRRRRRLGLRYRLRRPRPRVRVGQGRQHPGDGYRGLLQHRRSGVEGHPPRRGGQVRGVGQDAAEEGPRPDGHRLRQLLCRQRVDGGQGRPDRQGVPGGRKLRRPVADHRLLALHRARHRHDAPARSGPHGGGMRLLAAVPLRPAPSRHRRTGTQARKRQAQADAGRIHGHRNPLQARRTGQSRALQGTAGPRRAGPGSAQRLLRTDGRPVDRPEGSRRVRLPNILKEKPPPRAAFSLAIWS